MDTLARRTCLECLTQGGRWAAAAARDCWEEHGLGRGQGVVQVAGAGTAVRGPRISWVGGTGMSDAQLSLSHQAGRPPRPLTWPQSPPSVYFECAPTRWVDRKHDLPGVVRRSPRPTHPAGGAAALCMFHPSSCHPSCLPWSPGTARPTESTSTLLLHTASRSPCTSPKAPSSLPALLLLRWSTFWTRCGRWSGR
jgi:hypothetical protein